MSPKDFDGWNGVKKRLNEKEVSFYPKIREIWWCSIGVNIGSEQDGKNNRFDRPVLIVTVFNKELVRVVPLISKVKDDRNHIPITYGNRLCSAIVSYAQTISSKRLHETNYRIDTEQFDLVLERLKNNL